MKLTLVLLTATILQVSAATYAQQVTLKVKNATIKEVFEKIQTQTGYDFLYNADDLKQSGPVTLNLQNMSLKQALDVCFANQPLVYSIENNSILITKKPVTPGIKATKKVITGKVTDDTGGPLVGVSIKEKGTQNGVSTDSNGKYAISVADKDAVLVFSFIGFVVQEMPVSDSNSINVKLKEDNKNLNEVVVVGYGTQTKMSLTGAVNQVTAKDIEDKPVLNVLQALQGEAPNLIIQQNSLDPGSTPNLNIRGVGTTGDNSPLVVIDGIVGGNINTLNPNDVASVSILKDAGSAAIYGSRAANGVILVTTKSGSVNQKPSISFNNSYGIQHPDVLLKKVDASDNAYYKNESLVNSGLPPAYTPEQIQQLKDQGNGTWDAQHVLRNAPLQSYNVAISGGGPTSSYFISGGYQDQGSNIDGNGGSGSAFGYQKYNLRMNQTSIIGKLKVNLILSYSKTQNKTNTAGDNNIFADADRVPYNYSWQDAQGRYLTNPVASQFNVLGSIEQGGYNLTNNDEFFGTLNGQLSITKDLKLTGIVGATVTDNSDYSRTLQVNNYPSGVSGDNLPVFDNSSKQLLLNSQVFMEYNKQINDHKFKVLLGISNESYSSSGFQLQELYTDPQLGIPTTGTILDASSSYNSNNGPNNITSATSLDSFFGRLNYSYKDRYLLEGDFREDGSSKFAAGHRWGFFPSISGSWVASEESFMKSIKNVVNTLKFRASYGVLGNQNVNAYQYQTTYFPYQNAYGFNNSVVGGSGYNLGNPDLTWERAATLNIAMDAAFLDNKLNVSFDYFNKVTKDILAPRSDVPALFGAGFPDYNISKVGNRGWEATVAYTFKTNEFTHNFSFNIANSSNKLLAFSYGATQQINNLGEYSLLREVGGPVTQYYGYKVAGIFQTEAEVQSSAKPTGLTLAPGDLKYVDQNHDGVIDQKDMVPLGNPFPKFTFGFTYRVAVKGFDLSIFIQGVGKRTEFIRGEDMEPFHYNYGNTLFENQTDFWTPSNPGAKYPRLAAIGSDSNTNNWRDGSDIYSLNAAYARLKNVNIGYTFPKKMTRKAGIEKLRISAIGQNLYTLTKLKFIDPETSEFDSNTGLGAASNSGRAYPLPIFYGMGLDLTF
ncbi:TonB-dependent receptor [Pedobacter sp. L105]|uniref:TonB-dependent receptor n=1 Tax=Pedobacter sp. L105 TaxID=1641871 RepID=UPI0020B127E0|nr:TonB-dependent receptor [Pedobacter sp. L105]